VEHCLTRLDTPVGDYAKAVFVPNSKIVEINFVVVFATFVFDSNIRNAPETSPFQK
jgi:hypothetical protein